ncbi:tetratricopeptide repeat protein [Poriferisphaera sp. WC338]|uniref:tetratricopeptide repeat protein n=1 Tax=Poriferisphaera sp. WC338 TaxID=3425129 RepID=UPI003D81A3F5
MKYNILCTVLISSIVGMAGCIGSSPSKDQTYESPAEAQIKHTQRAANLNRLAVLQIENGDYEKAIATLKKSLGIDMDFAPAHNNLGLIYYEQEQFYTAAWEFEYAVKLMDNPAEPLNNLGMVYEAVGQYKKAHSYYEKAYEADPDQIQIVGNFARNQVRQGLRTPELKAMLDEIILKDSRADWIEWATEQRVLIGEVN